MNNTKRLVAAVTELSKKEGVQLSERTIDNNCLDLKSFLRDSEGILSPDLIKSITNVATN